MFERPEYFWLFLALPFVALLFIFDILLIKKRAKKIAGKNVRLIIPYYSEGQRWIRLVFYIAASCLTILALARPRWGMETIDSKIKGRDILILLDVSYSMATPDVIPSRLDSAKINIAQVLESEPGDRIGLMIFSGESELVSPVTHDYAAVRFFLDSIYPGMLRKDGTDIGNALLNAVEAFEDEGVSNKMILLITDGENLQGNLRKIIKKINNSEIKIFTTGVGTSGGEPIPIKTSKGEIESYVKDDRGNHVISKLDQEILKFIANETKGEYFGIIKEKNSIVTYLKNVKSIEKKDQKSVKFEQKKERYDIFLIPALILFCMGFILDQGKLFKIKYNRFEWLFNKNSVLLLMILLSIITVSCPLYSKDNDVEIVKNKKSWIGKPNGGFWGNIHFKREKYKKALQNYFDALNMLKEENLARLNYNIGNTFYKINDLKKAGQFYENATSLTKDARLKSMIFYNQGLVEFKNQNYSVAAELFKNSLKFDEEDNDARYNYAICEALKKEAEDNKNKNEQNRNNKNQEENEKNNKNNQDQEADKNLTKEDIEKLLNALDEKEKKENRERSFEEQKRNIHRGRYW